MNHVPLLPLLQQPPPQQQQQLQQQPPQLQNLQQQLPTVVDCLVVDFWDVENSHQLYVPKLNITNFFVLSYVYVVEFNKNI